MLTWPKPHNEKTEAVVAVISATSLATYVLACQGLSLDPSLFTLPRVH